jgi:poly(3-hydroxybutyrate) depolymerase
MNGGAALEDTDFYMDNAKNIKKQDDWIDPFVNLKSKRSQVYLFTGGADKVVRSPVVRRARDLYEALGVPKDQIKLVDKVPPPTGAGHSWVTARAITKDCCNACDANAKPFIDNCGYDQARDELEWIYGGPLEPPAPALNGRLVSFDQRAFVENGKGNGLADMGYLFVPKECEPGSAPPLCKLQVVLHGCLQSAESFPNGNDTFIENIGVNEWADTNRIVVLYPQTYPTQVDDLAKELVRDEGLWSIFQTNKLGCWNFWGYAGDKMFPTKKGVQVSAIWGMIQRIIGQANN